MDIFSIANNDLEIEKIERKAAEQQQSEKHSCGRVVCWIKHKMGKCSCQKNVKGRE